MIDPYNRERSHNTIEKYKEKLAKRNENQNWILSNYFGKPGGGAPLRDSTGNTVTKMKTIADGNIYQLDSREFSKGDNNFVNE